MIYLIDSENITPEIWVPMIEVGKNDKFIMFLSPSTINQSIRLSLLAKIISTSTARLILVNCTGGKNTMDLCIAAKLGELITQERTPRQYAIVSNDTGYDGLIDTFQSAGHDIKRIGMKTAHIVPKPVSEPVIKAETPAVTVAPLTKKQKKTVKAFCEKQGIKSCVADELISYLQEHGLNASTITCGLNSNLQKHYKGGKVKEFIKSAKKSLIPAIAS